MKSLIIEGRYDSLITTLSNKLLQIIKDSYAATTDPDGKFAGEKIYFKRGEKILKEREVIKQKTIIQRRINHLLQNHNQ